jgi:hypothetical protein
MSKIQYEVSPGHSLLIGNKQETIAARGSDRLLVGPALIPEGILSEKDIKNKLASGAIRPKGMEAYDPRRAELLVGHTTDLSKGEAPLRVTEQKGTDAPKTTTLPKVNSKPSNWILDPEKIKDKTLDELLVMISDRTDSDEEIEATRGFTQEEAVQWLSQDFSRTSPALRLARKD